MQFPVKPGASRPKIGEGSSANSRGLPAVSHNGCREGFRDGSAHDHCGRSVRSFSAAARRHPDGPRHSRLVPREPGSELRVVVHLVDPGVWFNIQSGRLNLAELLSNDTVQAVVMVRNPDGSASRQYRLVGPSDLAATVHVPLQG